MTPKIAATTAYGRFVGRQNAQGVIEFKGIPYARYQGRWKEALPPLPTDETFEAFEFAPMLVQPYWPEECTPDDPQSENPLFLNIATTGLEGAKPVMVFIHGGSYTTGWSGFDGYWGDQLVADSPDIVFVNFDYRMGLFGMLDLSSIDPEGVYDGSLNLITKDEIMALRWIKENIAAFGGDPENITLFGQSAGSYSIATLMTIPEACTLFNKGICMSGVFDDNSLGSLERAAEQGRWFVEKTGIKSIDELGSIPTDLLRQLDEEMFFTFPLAYSPIPDGKLIPFDMLGAIASGTARDIKLMVGNTDGDGERLVSDSPQDHLDRALRTVNPRVLNEETMPAYVANHPELSEAAAYMQSVTDVRYRFTSLMLAEEQQRYNDVYAYLWKWVDPSYPTRAPHCIDLVFVMDKLGCDLRLIYEHGRVQGPNPPKQLSREAQAAFVNFAKHGAPNGPGVPVEWPAYDLDRRATCVIDHPAWQVVDDFGKADRELFMPLYSEYERRQQY